VSRKRAFGPLATSGALGALLILFLPAGVEKAVRASGWERFAFFAAVLLMGSGLLASQSVGASGCFGGRSVAIRFEVQGPEGTLGGLGDDRDGGIPRGVQGMGPLGQSFLGEPSRSLAGRPASLDVSLGDGSWGRLF